jgi:septal ring factor EnvC (AmiA/AmiB activator)
MFGKVETDSDLEIESPNSINDLDLLTSLQKMKTEEQALLEQKQRLVATEQNLHNKLVKEIERKKTTIANLTAEITDLQNRTKQLEEALDIDIYNKTQTLA